MQQKVIEKLKQITKHQAVKLIDRGNSAIFIALSIAKKINPKPYILIPDQGGWISFKTYPKLLGFEIKELKTDKGVIDLDILKEEVKTGSALLITSFAGYFAEQPLKKISKICHKNNCLLIEDASGAVCDEELCNGKFSDIIVASFGRWKPVNLNYGGFISVKSKDHFDKVKQAFSLTKIHPNIYKELLPKLNNRRLKYLLKLAEKVKEDLKNFKIFHKDKRGINVVTEYNQKIIDYCNKNNYEYLICPKDIRINEKAISIELKRK